MTEVTMLIGLPASGKTYYRTQNPALQEATVLSRDQEGGSVAALVPRLDSHIAQRTPHVVLDCTFVEASARAPFVAKAREHGTPIHAVFFQPDPVLAQFNACWRMCTRHGKVLRTKEDYREAKGDPNVFPPGALFKMNKTFETPSTSEGFASVSEVQPVRWSLPKEFRHRAIMIDYDGTVRKTKSGNKYPQHPSDIEVFPQAARKLQALASDGYLLLGASNQSGVARGKPSMTVCHDCFAETNRQLGVHIEYDFDYSPAGPIVSWHRKPMPGMGVDAIWRHKLDPSKVVYVGDMTSDRTFAVRCGFKFEWAKEFFGL